MTARDEMLRSVREALGRTAGQRPPEPPPVRLTPKSMTVEERIALFCAKLEGLAGKTHRASGWDDARAYVERVIAGRDAVASRSAVLKQAGIPSLAGVSTGYATHEELKAACAATAVGVSSASFALADTGSLVMLAGAEEERLVSLLPPVHVAVLPRERILTCIDELFSVVAMPVAERSSMVFITGPSRTADIEQILVRGVHGPGEIHVVIV